MSAIPEFEIAVGDFRRFLTGQGHPGKLCWVFSDDLWTRGPTDVLLRFPPRANLVLAKKVYGEGRERGLIQMLAVATARDYVAANVWYPKHPEEEVQGWSQGLKLSITQPLPPAKLVNRMAWLFVRLTPEYRRYQRSTFSIGSRRWANA